MTAIELIAAERARQRKSEGRTHAHDDRWNQRGELADAAASYALAGSVGANRRQLAEDVWPWELRYFKPTPTDRVRELVKAGALIVAEIERLQRAEPAASPVRLDDHLSPQCEHEAGDGCGHCMPDDGREVQDVDCRDIPR